MKARAALTTLATVMALSAVGCGGNGAGYFISGTFAAAYTDPSTGQPASPTFLFPNRTRIEGALPAGQTSGLVGQCMLSNERVVRFQRIGATAGELTSVEVRLVDASEDNCTNCKHGEISLNLGSTTFRGEENRGNGNPTSCMFTTRPTDPTSFTLDIACAGLTAAGDPRTVTVSSSIALNECDVATR